MSADAEELRARALLGAPLAIPRATVGNDVRHRRQGLDVVDRGGHTEGAHGGGERGLHPGLAATAFQGVHEARLFTADIGTAAQMDGDVDVVARTQNVLAHIPLGVRVFQGLGENLGGLEELTAAIDVDLLGADGVGRDEASLDELVDNEEIPVSPAILEDSGATPEQTAERADMMMRIRRVIDEELTERQRRALIMLGMQGMPMEEAARRLKTNRNALYKLLHDARLRLKQRLQTEGLDAQEVLAAFEQG